jgi:hypothetical protein
MSKTRAILWKMLGRLFTAGEARKIVKTAAILLWRMNEEAAENV